MLLRRPEVAVEPGKSGEDLKQLTLTDLLESGQGRSIIKPVAQPVPALPPAAGVAQTIKNAATAFKRKGRPKLPRNPDGSIIRTPKPGFMTPMQIISSSATASTASIASAAGKRDRKPPPSIYEEIGHTTLNPESSSVDKRPHSKRRNANAENVAEYTSYEELQREAGAPGVYYEEEESAQRWKENRQTTRKPAHILTFKSDKLKGPEWLDKNKGSWVEPFSAAVAAAMEEAEQEQQNKRRRPQPPKSTPKKDTSDQDANMTGGLEDSGLASLDPQLVSPIAVEGGSAGQNMLANGNTSSLQTNPTTEYQQSEQNLESPSDLTATGANLRNIDQPPNDVQQPMPPPPLLPTQESLQSTIVVNPVTEPAQEITPKPKRKYMTKARKAELARQAELQAVADSSTTPDDEATRKRKSDADVGTLLITEYGTPPGKKQRKTKDTQEGASRRKSLRGDPQPPMNSGSNHVGFFNPLLPQLANQGPASYRSPYAPEASLHPATEAAGPLGSNPMPTSHTTRVPTSGSGTNEMISIPSVHTQRLGLVLPNNSLTLEMMNDINTSEATHGTTGISRTQNNQSVSMTSTSNIPNGSPSTDSGRRPSVTSNPGIPSPQATDTAQRKKGRPGRPRKPNSEQLAIESALVAAQDVAIPNTLVRLAAIYEGVAGNLILSADKAAIQFYGLDQHPPQLPLFDLLVEKMTQNPITSVKGSYPMELRITGGTAASDETGNHQFQFASTHEGTEAAALMRSKLVAALIAAKMRAGVPITPSAQVVPEEVVRPWLCEKCNKRFKNDIGLKYHLTKSQTACNPNYDPILNPRKQRGGRAPKDTSQKAPRRKRRDSFLSGEESDSDDYLKPGRQASPKATKRYVNLPHESELLDDVEHEFLFEGPQPPSDSPLDLSSKEDFQNFVLDIIRKNGGLFPAERSVWLAAVGAWIKNGKKPDTSRPESKYLRQALDDLILEGKLIKSQFSFRDGHSRGVNRHLVTEPELDLKSSLVDELKEAVKKAHPNYHVPPQWSPPDTIIERLQIAARRIPGNAPEIDYDVLNELDDAVKPDDSNDDEFRAFGLEHAEHVDSDEFMSDRDEPDVVLRKQQSLMALKATQSRALKRKWEASKLAGSTTLAKSGDGQGKPKRQRTTYQPRKNSKKEFKSVQTWDTPLAFLPDPQSGAWANPVQLTVIKEMTRPGPKYRRPEPITFMQAPNGSWSERPFGHGVNPIFSRPKRLDQKDADATMEYYQGRVDKGFRPVMFPPSTAESFVPLRRPSATPSMEPEQSSSDATQRRNGKRKAIDELDNIVPKRVSFSSEFPRRYKKREYTARRPPSIVSDDEDDDLAFTPLPPSEGKRTTRNSAKAAEAEGVAPPAFEQLNFDLLRPENPGLRTLPQMFGLDLSAIDTEVQGSADYAPKDSEAQFVEAQATFDNCNFKEGSWVENLKETARANNYKVKWRKNHIWDMESIPYEDLKSEPEDYQGMPMRSGPKRKRPSGQPAKSAYRKKVLDPRFSKKRKTTGKPSDFDGLVNDLSEVPKKFGVEVAPQEPVSGRREGRNMDARLPVQIERRLVAAIIAVKTITGGIHGKIDWILLCQLFPQYSTAYMTRFWKNISTVYIDAIEQATEKFRDLFPEAYKNGEVPSIDYDNLLKYDWNAVIKWVLETINPVLTTHKLFLPGTMKEVQEQITVVKNKKPPVVERGGYFDLNTALYRRLKVSASKPGSIPIPEKPKKMLEEDEIHEANVSLAKSWVRAVATTPQSQYNVNIAGERLNELGNSLINEALAILKDDKIIKHCKKGRATPGRSYEVTEFFNKKLHRHMPPKQFLEAIEYKRFLDKQFAESKDAPIRVDYLANEGTLLCITSLQAHGQLRTKAENVNCHAMKGLKVDDFYSTERIPKSRLIFQMDIYFTPLYTPNDNIPILQNVINKSSEFRPPRHTDTGDVPIPIWRDIDERINPELWGYVLVGIVQLIALRGGIDVKGLRKCFEPVMEEWEVRLVIEWGCKNGLFKRLHERIEGWTVVGEWWLVLGGLLERDVVGKGREKSKEKSKEKVKDKGKGKEKVKKSKGKGKARA